MNTEKSIFQTLNEIDVMPKTKKKAGLSYLPWSSALEEVLKRYPNTKINIIRNANGWNYFTDGRTCWVETEVEINGITQGEMLAVMDFKSAAISAEKVTSVDVNKAIKRCLVKNLAMFGLGLNLYYGEELSDNAKKKKADDDESLRTAQKNVIDLLKSKVDEGCDKAKLFDYIQTLIGTKNPSNVKDIKVLEKALEDIKNITSETLAK